MNSNFAQKLGLHIRKINIGAQKIDNSTFKTFRIVIATFQVDDKFGRPRIFQKIFLVVNTKYKIILWMFFLKLSNADVSFSEETLLWKSYTTNKTFFITKWVQIIDKIDFIIVALDADSETFVVLVPIWEQEEIAMDIVKKAQIKTKSGA